ncbi:MAG: hypothetical protein MHPSP_001252, partial [Paramarteilia canceri]
MLGIDDTQLMDLLFLDKINEQFLKKSIASKLTRKNFKRLYSSFESRNESLSS